MRFFEYESKRIVARAGIPTSKGGFAKSAQEARRIAADVDGAVVIKSQVLTGGRMKAGGVKFADSPAQAEAHAAAILNLEINGHEPRGVLVDGRVAVAKEYYAGVVWDGIRKQPVMLFSDMGGIDIEEVAEQHPDHVGRGHFSNLLPLSDFQAKQVVASVGVTGARLNRLVPILTRLAQLFVEHDMTLAEINPLGELEDGSFVALDAHIEMENEARGRQEELLDELGVGDEETRQAREATPFELAGEEVDAMDHRGVRWRRSRARGRPPSRPPCARRPPRWEASGKHEHPHRRRHDLHRPGHHRPRGREPHARVPGLRQGRQDRGRRDPRTQGPRSPRRAG